MFDRELARRVQVRAGTASLGKNLSAIVAEETERLGAADVDAEHVHGAPILC